jgi:RNA polymerase sigma-70 factor (ECF subfamily)
MEEQGRCRWGPSCPPAGRSGTRGCLLAPGGVGAAADEEAQVAAFCEAAWRPVYRIVRGSGCRAADAEDLTQAYFARFLEKDYMRSVRTWRGCLRPFLRVSVRHFLSNERDRERAAKRGSGRAPLSLDSGGEEGVAVLEPADRVTPEVLLERRRAEEALARAVSALKADFQAAGRSERFARLQNRLVGEHTPTSFGRIAREWGVGESAVRVMLLRLRRRLAALLREEQGLGPPEGLGKEQVA